MKEKEPYDNNIKGKVSEKVHEAKRLLADFLNARVNGLSASHRRITLLMFGLLMGAICLAQVLQSLRTDETINSISIHKIALPKGIQTTTEEMRHKMEIEQLNRVTQLKRLLDSLSTSEEGSKIFDSLIHMRPGLMDSVNLFIQNYQSH